MGKKSSHQCLPNSHNSAAVMFLFKDGWPRIINNLSVIVKLVATLFLLLAFFIILSSINV